MRSSIRRSTTTARRASWFSLTRHEGEGGGDAGTGGGDAGTGGTGGGDAGGTGTGSGEGAPQTFTQADVERILSDRLKRQKEQFAGFEEFKAKAGKLDEITAAQQTELERAQAAATTAEQARLLLVAELSTTRVQSAVTAAAAAANAVDPETVVQLLQGSDAITVGDDGQVVGAAEAVTALLAAKPFLVKPVSDGRPGGQIDQGGRGGNGGTDFRNATADEVRSEMARYGARV